MSNTTVEDPIQRLRDDHDAVLGVLDDFEAALVDLLGSRPREAAQRLREGLEVLEIEVREHGELEESILFPTLRKNVAPPTIENLAEEHAEICRAIELFSSTLRAESNPPVTELHWLAVSVVDLLRRHMDRETDVLFELVAHELSGSEYESLAHAMHQFRHERPQSI